jgi:TPR repeat protein
MELGDIFRQKGGEANLAKAAAYYERAARRGHRDAPYWLGVMRESHADHHAAAECYELAATRGNRHAQSRLAEMYRAGEGVGRDLVVASFWQMAAHFGNSRSVYASGECALRHKRLFAQFVWKAANQGHAEAQHRIARMLHEAAESHDEASAALWMRKAAEHGHENARELLSASAAFTWRDF